jgi:hypothetical protein
MNIQIKSWDGSNFIVFTPEGAAEKIQLQKVYLEIEAFGIKPKHGSGQWCYNTLSDDSLSIPFTAANS